MEIVRYSDKCIVKQDKSTKEVEAEILEFREHKNLIVVVNKSVKIPMVWNGQLYEGRMAGIDFTTKGPKVTRTSTGR